MLYYMVGVMFKALLGEHRPNYYKLCVRTIRPESCMPQAVVEALVEPRSDTAEQSASQAILYTTYTHKHVEGIVGEVQELVKKYNQRQESSDESAQSNLERQDSGKDAICGTHATGSMGNNATFETHATGITANTYIADKELNGDIASNGQKEGETRQIVAEDATSKLHANIGASKCGSDPNMDTGGCASNMRKQSVTEGGSSCTSVQHGEAGQCTARLDGGSTNGRCVDVLDVANSDEDGTCKDANDQNGSTGMVVQNGRQEDDGRRGQASCGVQRGVIDAISDAKTFQARTEPVHHIPTKAGMAHGIV